MRKKMIWMRNQLPFSCPIGYIWSVEVPVVLVSSIMLMMILMVFLCHTYQEKWWGHLWLFRDSRLCDLPLLILYLPCPVGRFYRVKCLHIPDPSKYFASLHSIHEGNFQVPGVKHGLVSCAYQKINEMWFNANCFPILNGVSDKKASRWWVWGRSAPHQKPRFPWEVSFECRLLVWFFFASLHQRQ